MEPGKNSWNETGSITILDFELYCKAIVMKQYGTSRKTDTEIMEQNREPRKKPTIMRSINFGQSRKEYLMGKKVF